MVFKDKGLKLTGIRDEGQQLNHRKSRGTKVGLNSLFFFDKFALGTLSWGSWHLSYIGFLCNLTQLFGGIAAVFNELQNCFQSHTFYFFLYGKTLNF